MELTLQNTRPRDQEEAVWINNGIKACDSIINVLKLSALLCSILPLVAFYSHFTYPFASFISVFFLSGIFLLALTC